MTVLDTSKIRVGMELTYQELCGLLGVEVSSNREYQIKIFCRYMDLERKGYLYIVKEVYSDPDINNRRRGNNIRREILDGIKPETEVKNYHALCDLLGLNFNTNMKKQMQMIKKYIDVEKIEGTRRYIIHQVYDNEELVRRSGRPRKYLQTEIGQGQGKGRPRGVTCKEHIDKQGYNLDFYGNTVWIKSCCNILLHECLKSGKKELVIRYSNLPILLGMKLSDEESQRYDYSCCRELEPFDFWVDQIIMNIVQYTINNGLGKRNRVFNIFDAFFYSDSYHGVRHEASPSEEQKVIEIMTSVAKKYNLPSYGYILWQGHPNYNKALREMNALIEEELGWKYYWKYKRYVINPSISDSELEVYKDIDILKEKQIINKNVVVSIRGKVRKKIQEHLNYHPNAKIPLAIGNANKATKEMYDYICRELETIIDKKIRLKT